MNAKPWKVIITETGKIYLEQREYILSLWNDYDYDY